MIGGVGDSVNQTGNFLLSNEGKGLDPFGIKELEDAYFSDLAPVRAVRGKCNVGAVVGDVLGGKEKGAA